MDTPVCAFLLTIEQPGEKRRSHAEAQMAGLGVDGQVVNGFTGSDPEPKTLYSKWCNLAFTKRSLSAGEIACYAGHRRIWEKMLDADLPYALVLEDDFFVPDPQIMRRSMADCIAGSDQWDIVKFLDFGPRRTIAQRTLGATTLAAYKYPAMGTAAYLINAKAARHLLARKRIYRAVDEDLPWCWPLAGRIWSVVPNPVTDISADLGGSTLEAERQGIKKRRNIARSLWGNVIQLVKQGRAIVGNARL